MLQHEQQPIPQPSPHPRKSLSMSVSPFKRPAADQTVEGTEPRAKTQAIGLVDEHTTAATSVVAEGVVHTAQPVNDPPISDATDVAAIDTTDAPGQVVVPAATTPETTTEAAGPTESAAGSPPVSPAESQEASGADSPKGSLAGSPGSADEDSQGASDDENAPLSSAKHRCPDCGKIFRRVYDLNRHAKLHTGLKPHVCDRCGKKFSRADALIRHMRPMGSCAQRSNIAHMPDTLGLQTGHQGLGSTLMSLPAMNNARLVPALPGQRVDQPMGAVSQYQPMRQSVIQQMAPSPVQRVPQLQHPMVLPYQAVPPTPGQVPTQQAQVPSGQQTPLPIGQAAPQVQPNQQQTLQPGQGTQSALQQQPQPPQPQQPQLSGPGQVHPHLAPSSNAQSPQLHGSVMGMPAYALSAMPAMAMAGTLRPEDVAMLVQRVQTLEGRLTALESYLGRAGGRLGYLDVTKTEQPRQGVEALQSN